MKTPRRFARALLFSLLIGLLMATAATAKTGAGFLRLAASDTAAMHEAATGDSCGPGTTTDQGTSDEQGSDDQGTSDEQGSKDCDTQESSESDSPPPAPSGDREQACMEAAGVTGQSQQPGPDLKLTGLDNAIAHVLANCIKNPQAPGLLNALQHLVANRERHAAHDAEKAARKAAKAAEKAERKAGKSGS